MTDETFYKSVWNMRQVNGICYCEECGTPLRYSRSYLAHIISKGSNQGLRHNHNNIAVLCYTHHQQLDFGRKTELKIYPRLQEIKEQLNREYYEGTQ